MKILNLAISFWLAAAGIGQSFITPVAPVVCPPSVQALINAAPAGGTIYLPACTFTESVAIDKNLAIVGDSSGNTIFHPSPDSRIITLTGNHTLNLQYLTLSGGSPEDGDGGGAILASEGSLQISHSHIYNNSALSGGGIYQGNPTGTLYLDSDLIENNHAPGGQGGGVFANGTVVSMDTIFNTNTAASYGGGISVWSGNASFLGGTFSSNTAGGNGGAVNINNSLSITGVVFTANTSGDSGGAILQWNPGFTITITQSTFHANTAKAKGGAVYVNSVVTFNQDWFDSNVVDSGTTTVINTYGGGIYAGNSGNITLSPAVTVLNSKFISNATHCKLGCYDKGGGIYIESLGTGATPTLAVMSNDIFDANRSWDGGGVYVNYGQVNADHLSFTNNIAGYGAGMATYILDGEALFFKGNQAEDQGGGVRGFNLSIKQSTFLDNTAKYAGGSALFGGLITNLTNVLMAHNTEFGTGYGTISLGPNSTGTFNYVTITQPALGTGTAVYLVGDANFHIYNTIIANYARCYDIFGTLTVDHIMYSNDTQRDFEETTGHFINNGYNLAFDAQFVSPTAGDYHLKSTSPAIAGGLYTAGVDVDLDYRLRRSGHSAMGAYNFWHLAFIPILKK